MLKHLKTIACALIVILGSLYLYGFVTAHLTHGHSSARTSVEYMKLNPISQIGFTHAYTGMIE